MVEIGKPILKNILAIGVLLLLFGLGMVQVSGYFWEPATFQQTEGVITQSEVYPGGVRGDTGPGVTIEYRYTYDGESYTSVQVCPGIPVGRAGRSTCYDDVETLTAQYPEGTEATVYVNPDDPSESFLMQGEPPYLIIGALVLCLFFLWGIAMDTKRKIAYQ